MDASIKHGKGKVFRYTFSDGHTITSRLERKEVKIRMERLDWLRVLTEGFSSGEGKSIYKKALTAYNKEDNFTGIIRLSIHEKDFLGYMLEDNMLSVKDMEVINFYLRN